MLKKLHLENFKGFDVVDVPFRSVNLLTGLNSSGKSSVIQALLLLKQIDYQRDPSTDHVELFSNGDYVSQGSGRELLYEFADKDEIVISCDSEIGLSEWRFKYNAKTNRLITENVYERSCLAMLSELPLSYLGAERWGPRLTYPYEDAEQTGLGICGEYAIRYLIDHAEDPVENEQARHPTAKGVGLLYQVQAWLGELSPGVRIDAKPLREAGVSVVGFGFEQKGDVGSRYYRPTHVGFGLTYSLPLLVALLSAKPGTVLLLENPEAHLHPRAQTKLARLIALVGKYVQVIVETHSDHVMNGLRVEVKSGTLTPADIYFHYFLRDGVTSRRETPEIDSNGRLSSWPDGFFDEYEKSLAALIRKPRG